MKNEDIEQLLGRLSPRGVPPELRPRVLAAVASRLQTRPETFWRRRFALAAAASILVGIGLNVWACKASDLRMARLFGPSPLSKQALDLVNTVEKATDAQTGQWVLRQITARLPSDDAFTKYDAVVKKLIHELQIVSEEPKHETPEKDTQMDRHRLGGAAADHFDCQRHIHLDHRYTA
jgi:hypothetical protein